MPNVLTEASVVTCIHQAPVQLKASQHKLTVDGQAVILQRDLIGALVNNCPNKGPGLVPCATITTIITGVSTELMVDGQLAMLETATGLTNASPPAPVMWQVKSAGQTKLAAK
ncbi:MAG TPA: hypothetical protein P5526_18090 [Anaerolineae bacterium]|nr:hypothetical protein [Anaerolineae bacterium]